jgi:hypothetical protein
MGNLLWFNNRTCSLSIIVALFLQNPGFLSIENSNLVWVDNGAGHPRLIQSLTDQFSDAFLQYCFGNGGLHSEFGRVSTHAFCRERFGECINVVVSQKAGWPLG